MIAAMLIIVMLKYATYFLLSKRTIKILFTSDAGGVSRGTITAYTAASDVVKNYKVTNPQWYINHKEFDYQDQ